MRGWATYGYCCRARLDPDTPDLSRTVSGIAVGRVAGLGLLSLGLACWPGEADAKSQATRALLTYNLLTTLYLGYLRIGGDFAGYLLWPAFVIHALLTLLLARAAKEEPQANLNAIALLASWVAGG
jgi:hypothetical protein